MRRRHLIIAIAAFAGGLIVGILIIREPMQPLSREPLNAAEQRWRESGVASYSMRYNLNSDDYQVTVEKGIVTSVSVNGKPPRSTEFRNFTVEGLFHVLDLELENLTDPSGPFAASQGAVIARVRFNKPLGYPERYLRGSTGVGRPASIQVLEFKQVPPQ